MVDYISELDRSRNANRSVLETFGLMDNWPIFIFPRSDYSTWEEMLKSKETNPLKWKEVRELYKKIKKDFETSPHKTGLIEKWILEHEDKGNRFGEGDHSYFYYGPGTFTLSVRPAEWRPTPMYVGFTMHPYQAEDVDGTPLDKGKRIPGTESSLEPKVRVENQMRAMIDPVIQIGNYIIENNFFAAFGHYSLYVTNRIPLSQ